MLVFPDPSASTEYTDPNGSVWEFNGTGWVRQPDCPDNGGGGGTSGDGVLIHPTTDKWPLPSEPSIDLIAVKNAIYEVDSSDGSLSLYSSQPTGLNWKFANKTSHIAFSGDGSTGGDVRDITIVDYSTPAMSNVATVRAGLTAGSDGLAWSVSDNRIFIGRQKQFQALRLASGNWETWGPPTRMEDQLGESYFSVPEGLSDEEQTEFLLASNMSVGCLVSPRYVDGVPGSANSFVAGLGVAGNHYVDNCFQLRATSSGPVVDNSTSAGEIANGGTARAQTAVKAMTQHPWEDFIVWGGVAANSDALGKFNCGVYQALYQNPSRFMASTWNYQDPSGRDTDEVYHVQFSPSGNYVFMQKKSATEGSIYAFQRTGRLIRTSAVPTSATGARGQWSWNEKYFYVWKGDGAIDCFDFNDGSPVYVRKAAQAPSGSFNQIDNTTFDRSRF